MSNTTPATNIDELPCNFLEFLQQRRHLGEGRARGLLGKWLVNYEPGPAARTKACNMGPAASERTAEKLGGPEAAEALGVRKPARASRVARASRSVLAA